MVCFALLSFSAKISCILKIHGFYSLYKAKVYLHNQSAVTYVIEKSKEEAIIFIGNHVYLYEIGIFYLKILHFNRIRNKTVSSNTKYSQSERENYTSPRLANLNLLLLLFTSQCYINNDKISLSTTLA